MRIDHIAVLAADIENVAAHWALPHQGQILTFLREGTRELYLGPVDSAARILLIQAVGPGPYRRAVDKRGYGLHHIAFCVDSIPKLVERLSGSGWLLHPASLASYVDEHRVWFCRPGCCFLVEVTEQAREYSELYAQALQVSGGEPIQRLITALDCDAILRTDGDVHVIACGTNEARVPAIGWSGHE
jgi:hypothetical protein